MYNTYYIHIHVNTYILTFCNANNINIAPEPGRPITMSRAEVTHEIATPTRVPDNQFRQMSY